MKTLSESTINLKSALKFEEIIAFNNNVFKIEIISEEHQRAGYAKLSLLEPNKKWKLIFFIEPEQMKTGFDLSQYYNNNNNNNNFSHLFQDDRKTLINQIKKYSLPKSFSIF
tara:strand:- start:5355 stop:5690 length:336 start_codon:yes stop_codon:yes gene_type:complete